MFVAQNLRADELPAPWAPSPVPLAPPPADGPFAPRLLGYQEKPRYSLIIAGGSTFGAAYTMSVLGGYIGGEPLLAIPLAGPIIVGVRSATDWDAGDRAFMSLMVLDSLAQTAGAVLLLVGAFTRHKVPIYERAPVAIIPTASANSAGLMAVGHF